MIMTMIIIITTTPNEISWVSYISYINYISYISYINHCDANFNLHAHFMFRLE
jgi:hypothetical protein